MKYFLVGTDNKFLIYSNKVDLASKLQKNACDAVSELDTIDGYVIFIYGDSLTEENFHAMRKLGEYRGKKRVVFTGASITSGVLNAGLDNQYLVYLFCANMPQSLSHVFQEIGHVGQRQLATPETYMVGVVINSAGYISLLRRLRYNMLTLKQNNKKKRK